MVKPSLQNPFDELRSIVETLESEAGQQERLQTNLRRLHDWVRIAEQRRDRSGSIIASARDSFIAVDDAGRIVEWNRKAEEDFGHPDFAESQVQIDDLLRNGSTNDAERSVRPLLGTPARHELQGHRSDGSVFPAEVTVLEPQVIGTDRICSLFVRDISRRKKAENAIRSSEALYHSLVDR